jgi:hypothetical protein
LINYLIKPKAPEQQYVKGPITVSSSLPASRMTITSFSPMATSYSVSLSVPAGKRAGSTLAELPSSANKYFIRKAVGLPERF